MNHCIVINTNLASQTLLHAQATTPTHAGSPQAYADKQDINNHISNMVNMNAEINQNCLGHKQSLLCTNTNICL